MSRTIAYVRVSVDTVDVAEQRREIQEFSNREGIRIADFIEVSAPQRKTSRLQRIEELRALLEPGDNLVVTELSRLGKSLGKVIVLLNSLMEYGVTVFVIKQGLVVQQESQDTSTRALAAVIRQFAELELEFVSLRTKEVLAAKKAQGVPLGKRKGTIQASMYDEDREKIEELLRLGVSQRRIVAVHLGYGTPNSLNHYIRTRGLNMQPNAAIRELLNSNTGRSLSNSG